MGAFNGSGTFVRTYDWTTDEGNGINIEASRMDTEDDGFATGLSTCITKDGQTTITANIPFNSKKITGLANGSARTDSIALGQVQDGTYTTLGTAGGAADAYTATPSPAMTAYATGSRYIIKIQADNTGASTLNISAIGTKNIKKYDGAGAKVDVEAGDLQQDQYYDIFYDGTDIVVLNPQRPAIAAATESAEGVVELATAAEIATGTDANRVVTVANQGWTKISSATASGSSSIDFTGLNSTYSLYKLVVTDLVPATDGANVLFRTSTDNGSTYDSGASDYAWSSTYTELTGTPTAGDNGDNADTAINLQTSSGNAANEKTDIEFTIYNPSATSYTSIRHQHLTINSSGNYFYQRGWGLRLSAADVDAIRVIMSSGNITSGTFTLYGSKA